MNATEARQKSLDNQYENAMKEIDKAVAGGWTRCSVCFSDPLYPEVAERIAENGFDVKVTLRENGMGMSSNVVSWYNTKKKGEKGKVEYITEEQETIPYETITKDAAQGSEDTKNKVIQQGEDGIKEITYKVKYQNEEEIEKISKKVWLIFTLVLIIQ